MSTNDPNDTLLTDIKTYLAGARWPLSRSELSDWAAGNHATSQVLSAIADMKSDDFHSIQDVEDDYVND